MSNQIKRLQRQKERERPFIVLPFGPPLERIRMISEIQKKLAAENEIFPGVPMAEAPKKKKKKNHL